MMAVQSSSVFFPFILSIIHCTPQPFACTLLLGSCYLSVGVTVR